MFDCIPNCNNIVRAVVARRNDGLFVCLGNGRCLTPSVSSRETPACTLVF